MSNLFIQILGAWCWSCWGFLLLPLPHHSNLFVVWFRGGLLLLVVIPVAIIGLRFSLWLRPSFKGVCHTLQEWEPGYFLKFSSLAYNSKKSATLKQLKVWHLAPLEVPPLEFPPGALLELPPGVPGRARSHGSQPPLPEPPQASASAPLQHYSAGTGAPETAIKERADK